MVARVQVRDTVQRLAGVWPTLRKRDTLRDEIGRALMRHADNLEAADLDEGVTLLVQTARVQQDDGGPAAPPGPGEVLGCVLSAKRQREADERDKVRAEDWGTTSTKRAPSVEVSQRPCSHRGGCGRRLVYLVPAGAYYCEGCRTVTYA